MVFASRHGSKSRNFQCTFLLALSALSVSSTFIRINAEISEGTFPAKQVEQGSMTCSTSTHLELCSHACSCEADDGIVCDPESEFQEECGSSCSCPASSRLDLADPPQLSPTLAGPVYCPKGPEYQQCRMRCECRSGHVICINAPERCSQCGCNPPPLPNTSNNKLVSPPPSEPSLEITDSFEDHSQHPLAKTWQVVCPAHFEFKSAYACCVCNGATPTFTGNNQDKKSYPHIDCADYEDSCTKYFKKPYNCGCQLK